MQKQEQNRGVDTPSVDRVEDLSYSEAGKELLGLLVKVVSGLPLDEYQKTLSKKGERYKVDSFIKEFAEEGKMEEYLSRNFSIEMASYVLDAKAVTNSVNVAREKHVGDIPLDMADCYDSRFKNAFKSLEHGLQVLFTYGGQTPKGSFINWNADFFSIDRMPYIRRAMEIRAKFFDSQGFLGHENLDEVSGNFGNLAAEISHRQDLI